MNIQALNILIAGVGGQGTLLASRVLGALALSAGLDAKVSEVHGMAQRGGSVTTHVRIGKQIHSPMIDTGCADYILAFEKLEAARALPFLKPDGCIIVNLREILPMPVILGNQSYPEGLIEAMQAKSGRFISVDALAIARAAGNAKCVNTVMMAVLSAQLAFERQDWLDALKQCIPARLLDVNLKAFDLALTQQEK